MLTQHNCISPTVWSSCNHKLGSLAMFASHDRICHVMRSYTLKMSMRPCMLTQHNCISPTVWSPCNHKLGSLAMFASHDRICYVMFH